MENINFAIKTTGLTKQYGKHKAVDSVSINVESGKIYGLLGRNGAGKTSIMKMLLNLTSVTSGNAYIFGKSISEKHKEIYPRIGSIIETPGFYPHLSGHENLKIFARLRRSVGKGAVQDALKIVSLPYGDKKPFSKYSLGMKQRLGIANALMNDPEILILDEPTNGLDPIGIAEMRNLIKDLSVRQGKTILISSHQLSEMEQLVDNIGIIHKGVLLKESCMNDIEIANRKHISVEVSNVNKAVFILENKFNTTDYLVSEARIKIFDLLIETRQVNRALLKADIDVDAISVNTGSLEEYFKSITGGEGIA